MVRSGTDLEALLFFHFLDGIYELNIRVVTILPLLTM